MNSMVHLGLVYSFDFQFADKPNIWLQADINTNEALEVIKTGLFKNHSVSKIKLFAINCGDESVTFIYDVIAAKSGLNPWTTQSKWSSKN